MPSRRPLRVKFILPALTEATSPYWRPIKYSLFPPLGLATLAAYLNPDDEAVIVDEHVERLPLGDDAAGDLVVIQVYITNAQRAYRLADALSRARRRSSCSAACTSRPCPTKRRRMPTRSFSDPASRRSRSSSTTSAPAGRCRRYVSTAGRTLDRLPPIRRDLIRRALLPRPELHRRHARLPAALRLLLQGRVLRGRPVVLHPARRRRAGRDRSPAGPASLFS